MRIQDQAEVKPVGQTDPVQQSPGTFFQQVAQNLSDTFAKLGKLLGQKAITVDWAADISAGGWAKVAPPEISDKYELNFLNGGKTIQVNPHKEPMIRAMSRSAVQEPVVTENEFGGQDVTFPNATVQQAGVARTDLNTLVGNEEALVALEGAGYKIHTDQPVAVLELKEDGGNDSATYYLVPKMAGEAPYEKEDYGFVLIRAGVDPKDFKLEPGKDDVVIGPSIRYGIIFDPTKM